MIQACQVNNLRFVKPQACGYPQPLAYEFGSDKLFTWEACISRFMNLLKICYLEV